MPKCDFHEVAKQFYMKLQSNFTEITLRHGCSPVNLLHIFRTPFPKNTSEGAASVNTVTLGATSRGFLVKRSYKIS